MNFKKDYINYVLFTIIQNELYGVHDDARIRRVLEKIISVPDVAKAAFLAGKTAGLETLFKYLLYISDKIDKSQITIFNIKDNFEYDLQNLKKICDGIKNYRSEIPKAKEIAEEMPEISINDQGKSEETYDESAMQEVSTMEEAAAIEESAISIEEETVETDEESAFTLIENIKGSEFDDEVFGLEGITRSIEEDERRVESIAEPIPEVEEESMPDEELIKESEPQEKSEEVLADEEPEDEILTAADLEKLMQIKEKESSKEKEEDFEFEIKGSEAQRIEKEDEKTGSVTSDAYYKFENKFFEEVKILEKLFSNMEKECRGKNLQKLTERTLQSFTEIMEISSELADLTRRLSFDLTADIFMTINLLFTKAIKNPELINPEKIRLLSSSLLLVTSLIRGEDYLGYDELVNKIESLKEELKRPAQQPKKEPEPVETIITEVPPIKETGKLKEPEFQQKEFKTQETKTQETITQETITQEIKARETIARETIARETIAPETVPDAVQDKKPEASEQLQETIPEKPAVSGDSEAQNVDTVLFKMKYLVKEFEKNFTNLSRSEGKFSKFEMLDEIDNLNNLLRMLAKISASVKNIDALKLSEVSYVFLKYLKDYRMDLLDAEIQQIVKYIIFTYKMLLTERKPEDFDILVQYLNNPVKIFTDT
jgi:hypothetical protein